MPLATIIGSAGVSLLLIAFLLQQVHLLSSESRTYLALNFTGAVLACYSSWLIRFMPFVLLEAVWAAVALTALIRWKPSVSAR